jgi:hypothetical protein
MKLFDIENNKVIIFPEALLINSFKVLYDTDKSKDNQIAKEDLAFVVFWCHFKSPYKNFDEDEREEKIIRDVITQKDWKKTALIENAIHKYKELHTTYSMGLLEDVEYGLSQIRQYFRNNAKLLAADTEGKVTATYLANVDKVQKMIATIKGLKELVEKEINESNRIRGGGNVGRRELPKDKRK